MRETPVGRVVTLDILRGLAIIGMVFLHNGAFHFRGLGEALESPLAPGLRLPAALGGSLRGGLALRAS